MCNGHVITFSCGHQTSLVRPGGECGVDCSGQIWGPRTTSAQRCRSCMLRRRRAQRRYNRRFAYHTTRAKGLLEYFRGERLLPQCDEDLECAHCHIDHSDRNWYLYNLRSRLHPFTATRGLSRPRTVISTIRDHFNLEAQANFHDEYASIRPQLFDECLRRQAQITAEQTHLEDVDKAFFFQNIVPTEAEVRYQSTILIPSIRPESLEFHPKVSFYEWTTKADSSRDVSEPQLSPQAALVRDLNDYQSSYLQVHGTAFLRSKFRGIRRMVSTRPYHFSPEVRPGCLRTLSYAAWVCIQRCYNPDRRARWLIDTYASYIKAVASPEQRAAFEASRKRHYEADRRFFNKMMTQEDTVDFCRTHSPIVRTRPSSWVGDNPTRRDMIVFLNELANGMHRPYERPGRMPRSVAAPAQSPTTHQSDQTTMSLTISNAERLIALGVGLLRDGSESHRAPADVPFSDAEWSTLMNAGVMSNEPDNNRPPLSPPDSNLNFNHWNEYLPSFTSSLIVDPQTLEEAAEARERIFGPLTSNPTEGTPSLFGNGWRENRLLLQAPDTAVAAPVENFSRIFGPPHLEEATVVEHPARDVSFRVNRGNLRMRVGLDGSREVQDSTTGYAARRSSPPPMPDRIRGSYARRSSPPPTPNREPENGPDRSLPQVQEVENADEDVSSDGYASDSSGDTTPDAPLPRRQGVLDSDIFTEEQEEHIRNGQWQLVDCYSEPNRDGNGNTSYVLELIESDLDSDTDSEDDIDPVPAWRRANRFGVGPRPPWISSGSS